MILYTGSHTTQRKRSSSVKWSELNGSDTGDLVFVGGFNDKSVQVFGTFDGATVTMKGGNVDDAGNTVTLKDYAAANITFTAAGVNSVRDNIAYLHPVVSGGGVSTDLTVVVFME
jgi:hypothetical protein